MKLPTDSTKDLYYYAKEQNKKLDKIIELLSKLVTKP
jgi:hypothetical protein